MNEPRPLPDNTAQAVESGFLFDDWNLPEKRNLIEETALFDGKIIARMPDLGSEGLAKNIEQTKSFALGSNVFSHVLSVFQRKTFESLHFTLGTRQRFFRRIAVFGGIVLLCGMGILLLEQDKDEPDENSLTMTDIVPEFLITPISEQAAVVGTESAFPAALITKPTGIVTDIIPTSAIPAADSAAAPSYSAVTPEHAESVWNRPAVDSYSPWYVAPRQPESPPPPSDFATVDTVSPDTVTMTPMTPLDTPSMPVSPYERHLVAQYSTPSNVSVPPNNYSPNYSPIPGTMPTHERLVNAPGMTAPQNVQQSAYMPPQYYPRGVVPANVPVNSQPVQYAQYPYAAVAPPNYAPPGMPIPAGISTLPQQRSGYYPQQPYGTGPMPTPSGDFYGTPPMYRRY